MAFRAVDTMGGVGYGEQQGNMGVRPPDAASPVANHSGSAPTLKGVKGVKGVSPGAPAGSAAVRKRVPVGVRARPGGGDALGASEEEEAAALKIQSLRRGELARRDVAAATQAPQPPSFKPRQSRPGPPPGNFQQLHSAMPPPRRGPNSKLPPAPSPAPPVGLKQPASRASAALRPRPGVKPVESAIETPAPPPGRYRGPAQARPGPPKHASPAPSGISLPAGVNPPPQLPPPPRGLQPPPGFGSQTKGVAPPANRSAARPPPKPAVVARPPPNKIQAARLGAKPPAGPVEPTPSRGWPDPQAPAGIPPASVAATARRTKSL